MALQRAHAALAIVAITGAALGASESDDIGPRATALGGASVALPDAGNLPHHNPAFLGLIASEPDEGSEGWQAYWQKRAFGARVVDAQFGMQLSGELGDHLETLAGIDPDDLGNKSTLSPEDIEAIVTASNVLIGVDDPGNAFIFDGNVGGGVRIGSIAVGARAFGTVNARVQEVDLVNLGLDFSGASALDTEIDSASSSDSDFNASGYSFQTLSPSQVSDLNSKLSSGSDSVEYIDFQLTELIESGAVDPNDVGESVDFLLGLIDATDGSAGNDIDQNQTAVLMHGLGMVEIPVAYGRQVLPMLAVGVTGKLMIGRVYGQRVLVFDEDNDDVLSEFDEDYEETVTVGVDVGVLAHWDRWAVGLRGRNLNQPTFDGFEKNGFQFPDVELDPRVTIGGAFLVMPTLALQADIDLFPTDTLVPSLEEQNLAVGVEWDVARVVALRGGVSQNLAETDEREPVLSGGVGVNMYAVRIDLAVAAGLDTVEYDGEEYPEEMRASLAITVDF